MQRYEIRKEGNGTFTVIDNKERSARVGFSSFEEAKEYVKNAEGVV